MVVWLKVRSFFQAGYPAKWRCAKNSYSSAIALLAVPE
jgi:hypothetical protein